MTQRVNTMSNASSPRKHKHVDEDEDGNEIWPDDEESETHHHKHTKSNNGSTSPRKRKQSNSSDSDDNEPASSQNSENGNHKSKKKEKLKIVNVAGRNVCMDSAHKILRNLDGMTGSLTPFQPGTDNKIFDWVETRIMRGLLTNKKSEKSPKTTTIYNMRLEMPYNKKEFVIDGVGGPFHTQYPITPSPTMSVRFGCSLTNKPTDYWLLTFAQEVIMYYNQICMFGLQEECTDDGKPLWYEILKDKVRKEGGITSYSYPFMSEWRCNKTKKISRPPTTMSENEQTKECYLNANPTMYPFYPDKNIQEAVLCMYGDPYVIASDIGKTHADVVGNPAYNSSLGDGKYFASNTVVLKKDDEDKKYVMLATVSSAPKVCSAERSSIFIASDEKPPKKVYIPFQTFLAMAHFSTSRLFLRYAIGSINITRSAENTDIDATKKELAKKSSREKMEMLLTTILTVPDQSASITVNSIMVLGTMESGQNNEINDTMLTGTNFD